MEAERGVHAPRLAASLELTHSTHRRRGHQTRPLQSGGAVPTEASKCRVHCPTGAREHWLQGLRVTVSVGRGSTAKAVWSPPPRGALSLLTLRQAQASFPSPLLRGYCEVGVIPDLHSCFFPHPDLRKFAAETKVNASPVRLRRDINTAAKFAASWLVQGFWSCVWAEGGG